MSANKELIVKIRTSFLAIVEKDSNRFHKNDVQNIKDNDWSIERYVLTTKTEDAALKALVKTMDWRKSYGVNDFTDDYFPEELYQIGYITFAFKDKEGRPVLWTKIGSYHKSDLSPLIKQYLVYSYDKLDSQTTNQGWAVICDSTGSGLSNVDMDFSNFMVDVLQNYFPRGPKYIATVDLPWILNATAKLIMTFMNEELKSILEFIKKEELTKYMSVQSIPVHLNGTYDKDMKLVPTGVKPLEDLTHTKFTADQIKKIRSAFKSELK